MGQSDTEQEADTQDQTQRSDLVSALYQRWGAPSTKLSEEVALTWSKPASPDELSP